MIAGKMQDILDVNILRENLKKFVENSSQDFNSEILIKKDFLNRHIEKGFYGELIALNELQIPAKRLFEWQYKDKVFNMTYYYVKEKLLSLYMIYALTSKSPMRYNYITLSENMLNSSRAFYHSKIFLNYMRSIENKDELKKDEIEKIKEANEINIIDMNE